MLRIVEEQKPTEEKMEVKEEKSEEKKSLALFFSLPSSVRNCI